MKKINWKIAIITTIICLLPIILGIVFYNKLPDQMPVHYGMNNTPDRYASKNVALFVIPLGMALLQMFCCIMSDIKAYQKGINIRLEQIIKAIIPVFTYVIYIITIAVSLGQDLDVRRIICFIIGVIFILMGNYLPKANMNSVKVFNLRRYNYSEDIWRKSVRMMGYTFVILGIIFIISILLSEIFSIIAFIILFLSMIIESILSFYWVQNDKSKQN